MKNIFDLLTAINITIPDEQKKTFETSFNENYKTVAEVEKLKTARDNFKSQLDSVNEKLKKFDGVDVDDYKNQITALQNDLKNKDTEYQQKIADMEFNSVLSSALSESKAKNSKAVKALLDIDTLKSSKNQAEDIKTAIASVAKDNDYLFESNEPIKNPVKPTGTLGGGSDPLSAVRSAMGLPSSDKK